MTITASINQRVLQVMEYKQLSRSAFATLLGTSLPVLTHISSGRNKPGLELMQKLIEKFPDISPDWLLNGAGTMLRQQQEILSFNKELEQLSQIKVEIEQQIKSLAQIEQYHRILVKEINYLAELQAVLSNNRSLAMTQINTIDLIKDSIHKKLK